MTRILIAEDETRIASFLEKGLSASGFTTTVAVTGPDALRLARRGEYDLLILDVGLPEKDGFEVLHELRGAGSRLPIVMLTARDGVTDTVSGLEGGADDYVTKPFRFEELLARVRARLREERAPTETELAVGSRVKNGEARFWVRDDGEGIAADEQARVFRRFSRGAGSRRGDGSGLGLSIVQAIAQAHHGRVELVSGRGAGSTFTLVVPVDQPQEEVPAL